MTDEERDDAIARAAGALRAERHGQSARASETRARILATASTSSRHTPLWLAAAAVLVVGLGVPTAWAWSTGRIERWLGGEAPATTPSSSDASEPNAAPARTTVPSTDPITDVAPSLAPTVEAPRRDVPSTEAVVETQRPVREGRTPAEAAPARGTDERSTAAPPSSEDSEERADDEGAGDEHTVDPEERLAFQRADALHTARDHGAALEAWDAYLARHPAGRFAIEARYARAICLVRLGRTDDARAALAPFAAGTHGQYREREARALIEALGR